MVLLLRWLMDMFLVRACKGIVRNKATFTNRQGYWIPVEYLPDYIAQQLNCDKTTARPHLAWDMLKTEWRDMRHAHQTGWMLANAVLVTLPSGKKTIALVDF